MSKKMFDSAQASKNDADSKSLADPAEKFWKNLRWLRYTHAHGSEGGTIEPNSVSFILPDEDFRLEAYVVSYEVGDLVSGGDTWKWVYTGSPAVYYMGLESFPVGCVQDCVFKYTEDDVDVPIKILRAPSELKDRATYVLDNFDQGNEDLLLTYNKFHPLKINYAETEGWEAVVDLKKIKSISYPAGAKYTIDFIVGGQLAENQSGQSSAEGFPLNEMDPESNYVRMRYKNVNDVYYGEVSMVLHYEDTPVLRLTLPVEVIKPDVK